MLLVKLPEHLPFVALHALALGCNDYEEAKKFKLGQDRYFETLTV